MDVFLKLILAHLLGDYTFQRDHWVAHKEKKKWKSHWLLVHVLIHTILVFLFLLPQSIGELWWVPVIIFVTHWMTDAAKLQFQGKKKKRIIPWFFLDQCIHFIIIGIIAFSADGVPDFLCDWNSTQVLLLLVSILSLTKPAAIVIKILISGWADETTEKGALPNAGMYIGMLERLFVFGFMASGYWEGIGFLLAAKSVFRFGDLNKTKDRNLTEYILIGTLLSFGMAILTGMIYLYLKSQIN